MELAKRRMGEIVLRADLDRGAVEIVAGAQTRLALELLRPRGISIVGLQQSLPDIICRSPFAMALLDEDLRHLGASDAYCEVLQVSRSVIVGRTHPELFPDLPKGWEMAQQRCLAGEATISEDEWSFGNSDQPLRLSWQLHPWRKSRSKLGGAILFLKKITCTEVEEFKSADLLTILDNAPGLIVLARPSGILTFINKAGRELIGMDSTCDPTRLTFADLAHPSRESKFSGLPRDHNQRDEIVVQNMKTGQRVCLLLELRRIHDENGKPFGFAWIGNEKRNQDSSSPTNELLAVESQQTEKLESVCRIARRVAHDLNNALLIIDAYASMLNEELAADTHLASEAAAVHRAGSRATRLVQELMALSQF